MPTDVSNSVWQVMLLILSPPLPGGEVPSLSALVNTVDFKPSLRANITYTNETSPELDDVNLLVFQRSLTKSLCISASICLLSSTKARSKRVVLLPVVAIIGHVQLWADEEYFAIQSKHPAVVPDSSMYDWHAKVTDNVIGQVSLQQLSQHLPRVLHSVDLHEVVLTAVSRNLQFWANLQDAMALAVVVSNI